MKKELINAIKGSFHATGTSFAAFVKENNIPNTTAVYSLLGLTNGDKSREIRKKLHEEAKFRLRTALNLLEKMGSE